ncbi:cell adhesion [Porites harrisoni]
MPFTAKLLQVLLILQGSANVFGKPGLTDTALTGFQRAKCQQLRSSNANEQFPLYCKPGSLTVKYLNVGRGLFKTNGFSYRGLVLRTFDVQFETEQDGNGDIVAQFNGAILKCDGWAARKRKTCTIPRNLRPWSGIIKVKIVISHPSTRFQMAGTPVCRRTGFTGYNCNQDINECVVHKDKVLCAWKDGCVNTHGGYKCRCPPGYKVSSQDFRLCEKDIPQMLSRSSNVTVLFFQTATLPCRYSASGPVTVSWRINNRIIAIKRTDGSKQTINRRLTLDDSGDLMIHNTTFGDAGRFMCIVQNVRFFSAIIQHLRIESKPFMSVKFLVNGTHTTSHKYRFGENLTVDCLVVGLPVPTITWSHGQQLITPSARRKLILGPLPNAPALLKGAAVQLQLRIKGIQRADAGVYSCKAANRHGVTIKTITLSV